MAAWVLCSLPTSKTAIFSTSMLNTTIIVISVFESSLSSHRPLFLGPTDWSSWMDEGWMVAQLHNTIIFTISASAFYTTKGR